MGGLNMNALELQGLTKHYKDFTLGPLDLTLPGGTICGLIGENGAGKSTTIRLILDMVQRDGGTVTILGRDSRTASVRAKEEIGVVLGSEGIPLCLNAVQAGKVMAGIYQNWDAAAYAELCQKFGLPDKKQYKDYSTGMKMKLCIAVALAHHPKLLLLDEAGICASAGSACSAGAVEPSHVLLALGLTPAQAKSTLRLTLDATNTAEEIDTAAAVITACVQRLRDGVR